MLLFFPAFRQNVRIERKVKTYIQISPRREESFLECCGERVKIQFTIRCRD